MKEICYTLLVFLYSCNCIAQKKYSFEAAKMGSPFSITIYTIDSANAAPVAASAFTLADSINTVLSDYIDSSEINHLSASSGKGEYIQVSSILYQIIQTAQQASVLSNGAFDISTAPIVQLWRKARVTKIFPDKDSITAALKKTGYQYIHPDSVHQSIWLEKPGMQLDVGGIGKGFTAQAVLDFISAKGFNSVMVNAGGNIAVSQSPAHQKGWLIGISEPEQTTVLLPRLLSLQNMTVSTSGDVYQNVEINGKKYSHIVNPKTGIGLTNSKTVTVLAKDATTADWLSTACSVLSTKKAMQLIKKIKNAEVLITELRNGKIKQISSKRFKNYYF